MCQAFILSLDFDAIAKEKCRAGPPTSSSNFTPSKYQIKETKLYTHIIRKALDSIHYPPATIPAKNSEELKFWIFHIGRADVFACPKKPPKTSKLGTRDGFSIRYRYFYTRLVIMTIGVVPARSLLHFQDFPHTYLKIHATPYHNHGTLQARPSFQPRRSLRGSQQWRRKEIEIIVITLGGFSNCSHCTSCDISQSGGCAKTVTPIA